MYLFGETHTSDQYYSRALHQLAMDIWWGNPNDPYIVVAIEMIEYYQSWWGPSMACRRTITHHKMAHPLEGWMMMMMMSSP